MSVGKWKCVRCSGPVEEVDGKTQDCPECGLCPQCCECAGILWGSPPVKKTLKVQVNGSQIELPAEFFKSPTNMPPSWAEVIRVGPDSWKACPDRRMILRLLGVKKAV